MNTDTTGMETTLEQEQINFDSSQRCDRCGAQAHVQVFFDSGFDLLFCNHHHAENIVKLEKIALNIRKDTDDLK